MEHGQNTFCSVVMVKWTGRVLYPVNEWVEPKDDCGPLALFDVLEDALKFHDYMKSSIFPPLRLFKCEYEPSHETEIWHILTCNFNGTWKNVRSGTGLVKLPEGTVLASRVKLLKQWFL